MYDLTCAGCHGYYNDAIEPYSNWAASMMAQASRDPVWYAAMAVANQDADFAGDLCIRCHTPNGWLHGKSVPKPERVTRSVSGLEIRINATNGALQPHAGGVIRGWSRPIEGEIRFDQGIGNRNPDTDAFIWYNLAGAYDSNIALLLCDAENRQKNYERMADILRRTQRCRHPQRLFVCHRCCINVNRPGLQ